jgi:hypothetical protein
MANKFKNKVSANIHFSTNEGHTSASGFANVGNYTVPSGCVATIIGMTLANMNTLQSITADVELNTGTGPAGNISIVKGAPIPIGGSLVVVGGEQKVVLDVDESIQVRTLSGNVDVVMSLLESSQTA